MWSRRRYFYCYSENPVVLYFLLRFIILITLGNPHKVSLLNENHKFSVEILKPRAWQESFTTRASKKFLDCDQPPRLGDIVSCVLHTRKEIWERSRPISTKLTGSGKRWFAHISESFRCRYAVALKCCKFNLICMPLFQLLYFGRSVHFFKLKMIKQKKAFQHLATRHNKQTFMKMFRW